jgi:hypothetical protein
MSPVTTIYRYHQAVNVIGSRVDAATTAWVAAVVANGGTVSLGRQTIVDNLIVGIKSDGIWTKFDRLWLLAAENSQSALTDIKAASLATVINSPTFTADRGYKGNGAGSGTYIDSNFNPTTATSPQFVQNSACIFGWDNTGGVEHSGILGNFSDTVTRIVPGWDGDSHLYWNINSSTGASVTWTNDKAHLLHHLIWNWLRCGALLETTLAASK